MKIIIAPDSFKGSLSAAEVCDIMEKAILIVLPLTKIIKIPISDGGEGLVNTLLNLEGGRKIIVPVKDPLFRKTNAAYGILNGKTAVIEMAAASGLTLLTNEERNPMLTTTFGTGELIIDAIKNQGCDTVILGIGGSATNDGGMGVATALGVKFYDKNHDVLSPCGQSLENIVCIDAAHIDPIIFQKDIVIACDVDNPLFGIQGASQVYGPQKGASEEMTISLDKGLKHLGILLEKVSGKELIDLPGLGAAGGMALPLVALFDAQLKSGLEIVLDRINFNELIQGADLIITGEGKTDKQSIRGKVISGVGKRGEDQKIPVIVISGALEKGYEVLFDQGITAAFATYNNSKNLEWHIDHAKEELEATVINLFRSLAALDGKTNS